VRVAGGVLTCTVEVLGAVWTSEVYNSLFSFPK